MTKKWSIIFGKYAGLEKRGLEILNGAIADFYECCPHILSAEEAEEILKSNNIIIVGTPDDNKIIAELVEKSAIALPSAAEGYALSVRESVFAPEQQMIVIAGRDEHGVLYGAVDFVNKYCSYEIFKSKITNMTYGEFFVAPFKNKLPEWNLSSAPSVKVRGIWTWGHVIYDYERFFANMARLKLNEIVVWNDFIPLNSDDFVECAHSWGIKVIWGFSWGWDLDCSISADINDLAAVTERVVRKFEKEYAHSSGDGIYFQSFTELKTDYLGDSLVAELVTRFVNATAGELFKKYPELNIQFGLHATSVKDHMQFIEKVDNRLSIIWEDCGGFPFFGETSDLGADSDVGDVAAAKKIVGHAATLRGNDDKFGLVLKGLSMLDWGKFKHQEGNFIIGRRDKKFIAKRAEEKKQMWRLRQIKWVRDAETVAEIVRLAIGKNPEAIIEGLVEDGVFEESINLATAIYAEILWDCDRDARETVLTAMKFPCVEMITL